MAERVICCWRVAQIDCRDVRGVRVPVGQPALIVASTRTGSSWPPVDGPAGEYRIRGGVVGVVPDDSKNETGTSTCTPHADHVGNSVPPAAPPDFGDRSQWPNRGTLIRHAQKLGLDVSERATRAELEGLLTDRYLEVG